jgi:polyvinyl alcohol dehydrogenase (cytochrome)
MNHTPINHAFTPASAAGVIVLLGTFLIVAASLKGDENDSKSNHDEAGDTTWSIAGQNLNNSRSQPGETIVSTGNIASLHVKWTFTTGADVSATPTVDHDAIYFPDWAGNLYAVNKSNGKLIWSHQISDYNKVPGSFSRVSPAISGDLLIVGDTQSESVPHSGANIIAVDRHNGNLRWITSVDSHPAAIITGSPVVFDGTIFSGVSSSEEALAAQAAYPCCSFRGSIVALDLKTGDIRWKTYTLPDNQGRPDGYSGNAVWQPVAIDPARGSLYAGTGNNYEVPQDVKNCLASASSSTASNCFAADDLFDSALALDLHTGQIKWSKRVQGEDVWTVACIANPNPVACPEPSSPDFDFSGSGPNLLPHLVGFGQKSGMYWAFNPDNGDLLWSTMVGPGSTLGGVEWGSATDGQRIYIAITNGKHLPYPLIDGTSTTGGAWSALDVQTGKILWQTADPTGAIDSGSVSFANGVLFAPSYSGNMNALDASNGKILWAFPSGGSVIDGPSIVNGNVYWGSGYKRIRPGTPNNKVFAFTTSNNNGDEPKGDHNSGDN